MADYFRRKILVFISYSDCCLAEDIILHYILGVDTHKNGNQQNCNSQELKCSGEHQWCLTYQIMHRMDLYINTLTGTVFELRVSPYEAILSIKAKLQWNEGKPLTSTFFGTGFLLWENDSISLLIICKF